jgi:hypothetical protein
VLLHLVRVFLGEVRPWGAQKPRHEGEIYNPVFWGVKAGGLKPRHSPGYSPGECKNDDEQQAQQQ